MGTMVKASCKCGFQEQCDVGGGMNDYATNCSFPCLCKSCKRMVHVNMLKDPPRCPECGRADPIPYDDSRLIGTLGMASVASWHVSLKSDRELVLTNGTYLCPSCRQMTLRFKLTAFYD